MIDWVNVALNGLWIAGGAILLAAVSYHRWLADETGATFRTVRARSSWKISCSAGMLLVCAGVGYGLADRLWEQAAWTLLAAAFAYLLAAVVRDGRDATVRAKRSS